MLVGVIGFGDGLGLWLSSGHLLTSAFWGWVRVRVLGYGLEKRGRNIKSRDCALASDLLLVRANSMGRKFDQDMEN